jgi:alpha-L-fucosidase
MPARALLCALLALLAVAGSCRAATLQDDPTLAKRSAWWRDARFGMFIHWGVYAVPAQGEWYMNNAKVQVKDYEKYPPQFNPVKFNAKEWVSLAKAAGMKYITITSKHHDGFCMFDTKLTDYSIVKDTPYGRDPMKDLAAECRRQGIRLCFYYSVMDWHHPDYLPRRPWEAETRPASGADFSRYLDYMQGQLREILTNYGDIGVIWFDGGWEGDAAKNHSQEVVDLIRSIQPKVLINDRINLPEDFSTPEQTIPAGAMTGGRLWETCMTLNGNWGFNKDDHGWKSTEDLVHKLCDIASKGGNFLLNVGPTAEGVIPTESVERLQQVGQWMKVNGASIYGTEKSPFRRVSFEGRCTVKGDRLYLQVFQWPEAGIQLTGLKTRILSAKVLGSGETVSVGRVLSENPGSAPTLTLKRPSKVDALATVVELKLEGAPQVESQAVVTRLGADGGTLKAGDAEVHGSNLQYESDKDALGFWVNSGDSASWEVEAPEAGQYQATLTYACDPASTGARFELSAGSGRAVQGDVPATDSWTDFKTLDAGTLRLVKGRQTLVVRPAVLGKVALMNLRSVRLTPVR